MSRDDQDTDPPPEPLAAAMHNYSMAMQGVENLLGRGARTDAFIAKAVMRMEANINILVEGQRKILLRLGENEKDIDDMKAAILVGMTNGKRTQ